MINGGSLLLLSGPGFRVHIIFAHQLIAMVEDGFDGGSDGQQDDGLKV